MELAARPDKRKTKSPLLASRGLFVLHSKFRFARS